jgi:hypothetical protein
LSYTKGAHSHRTNSLQPTARNRQPATDRLQPNDSLRSNSHRTTAACNRLQPPTACNLQSNNSLQPNSLQPTACDRTACNRGNSNRGNSNRGNSHRGNSHRGNSHRTTAIDSSTDSSNRQKNGRRLIVFQLIDCPSLSSRQPPTAATADSLQPTACNRQSQPQPSDDSSLFIELSDFPSLSIERQQTDSSKPTAATSAAS